MVGRPVQTQFRMRQEKFDRRLRALEAEAAACRLSRFPRCAVGRTGETTTRSGVPEGTLQETSEYADD